MLINEVCKQTGLTKKAIEYYQSRGLVCPITKENGYREFTDVDLEKLKTIALLRRLDLTTDEIKRVLEGKDRKNVLISIKQAKQIKTKTKLARIELIEQLARGEEIEDIEAKISLLDQQATIKEKLLYAFPGYCGRYVSIHFGRFLNRPIKTDEQKRVYAIIVDFLDNMESVEIPEELMPLFEEGDYIDDQALEGLSLNMQTAYNNFETYLESNKESIIQYTEFKKSEEYQNSVMAKALELFRKFGMTSGYYDVFIQAMRKLSSEYDDYYVKMQKANEKFIKKFPEAEKWYT